MDPVFLVLVVIVATALWVLMAYNMRGITSEGRNSDAAKQIRSAARAADWRWPSDMHKYASQKAAMKDVGVLLAAVMQRMLGDRTSFYPMAAGCALAHSITSILLFAVSATYWSTEVGLLMFVLYIGCIWPYMIVLQGGFQGLCLMLLLLSLALVQLAGATSMPYSIVWYAASGGAFGAMLFSSASCRKLIPFYLGALIFSQSGEFEPGRLGPLGHESAAFWGVLVVIGSVASASVMLVLWLRFYGTVTHRRRLLSVVDAVSRFRGTTLREWYHNKTKEFARPFIVLLLGTAMFMAAALLVFSLETAFVAVPSVLLGSGAIVTLLLLPDIRANLRGYFFYWGMSKTHGHFQRYDGYFSERIGRTLREGTGGATWYARFFLRIAPFHSVFYAAAVAYTVYAVTANGLDSLGWTSLWVIVLSVTPALWSEATKGPKAALPYFPALAGMLLVIGHASFVAQESLAQDQERWLWVAAFTASGAAALWNLWVLATDVWPSKMGVARMERALAELGARTVYTYDTPYSHTFLDALPERTLERYEVRRIQRLDEVPEGYVVVPPTNSKSPTFQSNWVALAGEFDQDHVLAELLSSRTISRYALGPFKTYGSSKYWAQIADVASYRDLVLKEVTDQDRWRGQGWIVDAAKLHAALSMKRDSPWAGTTVQSQGNDGDCG